MTGGSITFLVVEDDDLVRRALVSLLKKHGTCSEADSLMSGMDHVTRGGWDGLLVDVRLGDGSGLDVLARARAHHLSAPAVVMSGGLDHTAINRATSLGARILSKPFDAPHLAPFLDDVMRRRTSCRVHAAAERARLRWSLTNRETTIVSAAIGGRSRDDYLSGVTTSLNTYKTQVRGLLEKTGHSSLQALALQLWNEE